MSDLTVTVVGPTGQNPNNAKLPGDVPMSRLLPALVTKLVLPPGTYKAMHKESGKELLPADTLAGAGIKDNDTLRILSDIKGG